jgi:hypothetical protein
MKFHECYPAQKALYPNLRVKHHLVDLVDKHPLDNRTYQ